MPTSAKGSKNQELFKSLRKYQTDIMCGQEIGNNWSRIPRQDQWKRRLEEEFEHKQIRSRCGHNTHDTTDRKQQWGGTAITSHGWISHHGMGAGVDKANLGRWTWARYRGREGMILRVVSVYCPCKNETGELNVYRQHKQYFQLQNDDRDPINAFWEDLLQEIQEWKEMGDQIVLGGDINDEVTAQKMTALCQTANMRNVIFERHTRENAPPTYSRNRGNRIVDGLWATTGIQVQRSGYLEAGDFPGDHCALWADITIESALGRNPPQPTTPHARRLKLSDPKVVQKYLKKYEELITEKGIFRRQYKLEASVLKGNPLTKRQKREANKIDQDRTICMQKAEKQCRKLRMGCVAFSDATEKPRKEISFWNSAIKRRKGGRVSAKLWRRKKKAAKLTVNTKTMTLREMEIKLREANKEYAKEKQNDVDSRIAFIETFPSKIKKKIQAREEQVRLGQVSRLVTGKNGNKSVTSVELSNGDTLYSKRGIEEAVKSVNEPKMRATEETPFMQAGLYEDFGYNGHPESVDAVLQGTYNPPAGTDLYTRMLLLAMQKPQVPQSSPQLSAYISTDDHMQAWRKAKEKTSAGISGLHFGMFKAQATQRNLAELDASMRNLAYSTGFVYERWKKGIDVQILKRSKDYRLEKLRTIMLLEADFNMNNKKVGKDVTWKSERDETTGRDNYGGRKNLRPVEISLNERLTFDSIWGKRGQAIMISNDAVGCFDRIAHMVAYMCLLRLGAPSAPVQGMIQAIQELTHYIRTAYGDSDTGYGNDPNKPPQQGLLQGAGSAPTGWASISTVLVEVMKTQGLTYKDWTLISKQAIEIACFAFVDDTDLVVTPDEPDQPTWQLIQKAQRALTTWEGVLRASGGKLHKDKSYWYLIKVIRENGQWTYSSSEQSPGNLYLENSNQPISATRMEVNEAKEGLGIQRRPDGHMKDEVQYLREKAETWKEAVTTKKLTRGETWYCLNSTIMKTIEYPLAATTMTREEIDYIMAPILKGALPKSGIQSKFPHKLLYGTNRIQGMTLQDPLIVQLIEHIQVILRHNHRPTPTHMQLLDNMEIIQAHLGSATPFWDLPFDTYGFLAPEGWMKFTWKAIDESPLHLKGPLRTFLIQREHDEHIMDAFFRLGFDEETMQILNNCRLYLMIVTLADMASANGSCIDSAYWRGERTPRKLHASRRFPKAYRPSANDWLVWQNALRETFMPPFEQHRRLDRLLGAWKPDDESEWIWWYSPTQHQVYERCETEEWLQWPLRQEHPQRPKFGPIAHPIPIDQLPLDIVRCSVVVNTVRTQVTKTSHGETQQVLVPPITTVYERFRNQPISAHWALQHVLIHDNALTIANAIMTGNLIAVSDGSFKLGLGTAAFVLEGIDSTNRIFGVNKVPGPLKEGDSYRCELAGLYSIILICAIICEHFQLLPTFTAELACDNKSSLRVFHPDYVPDPNDESMDIIQAIWKILRTSPLKWRTTHVKGHQDNHKTTGFTRLENLNIEMDKEAKAYWQILVNSSDTFPEPEHHDIFNEGWSVWAGEEKIVNPNRNTIYGIIQDPITIDKWVRLGRFPDVATQHIDWDSCEAAMKAHPLHSKRWITKHAADECGIGVTLVKWKMQNDSACPRCGEPETGEHVLQCTAAGANTVWIENFNKLASTMTELETHPSIQETMLHHVDRWRHQEPADHHDPDECQQAIEHQTLIGWKNLLEGLPAKQWQHLQQRHYNDINSRKTGKSWMKAVLRALHTLARDQWLHRNDIKHKTLRPRQRRMEERLDASIMSELLKGNQGLPVGDSLRFDTCIVALLSRPLPYKKAWLANLCAARQRQLRRRLHNDELIAISRENSVLLQWMETGRAV